jgi:hypothetical protein
MIKRAADPNPNPIDAIGDHDIGVLTIAQVAEESAADSAASDLSSVGQLRVIRVGVGAPRRVRRCDAFRGSPIRGPELRTGRRRAGYASLNGLPVAPITHRFAKVLLPPHQGGMILIKAPF